MKPIKVLTSAALATMIFSLESWSAFAEDDGEKGGSYSTKGSVTFEASKNPTNPVDPSDPGSEVTPIGPDGEPAGPGTAGPLSIDFASSLDFGTNDISNRDKVYYAVPQKVMKTDFSGNTTTEDRPNYVQISDKRGANSGWVLTVKQNGQFLNKDEDTLNKELTGAQIILSNPHAVSTASVESPTTYDIILDAEGETEQYVMIAQEGQGAMTWVDYFGEVEKVGDEMKNTAIQLEVPGSTPKDSVEYSTTLTWTLSDVVTD